MRPRQSHQMEVDGSEVHYQLWPAAEKKAPTLLMVHGGGAHSHWWDLIAGQLPNFRIVAPDLPGMGNSAKRDSYSRALFADTLQRVSEEMGASEGGNLYLVGHSFGGAMALHATHRYPDLAQGLVMVDSPIRPPGYDHSRSTRSAPIRPTRPYPTRDSIISRFRIVPSQPPISHWMHEYIARYSVRFHGSGKGWTWKFDEKVFASMDNELSERHHDLEKNIRCKSCFIYGTESALMTPEVLEYMCGRLAPMGTDIIPMPGLHHHLILEQPALFAGLLEEKICVWEGEAGQPE